VYEIGGQVYSHVINPGTGEPVRGLVEAVVIAESAMLADAWSTALVVRKQIPEADAPGVPKGFEALLIEADGKKSQTPGW
ncbi:MAG: thiamine biosynthesis lipoprotein, partial [Myxococcota bacterium]